MNSSILQWRSVARILPWCASHSTATACRAGDLGRLHLAARQCSSAPRTRHNQTSWTGDTRVHCTMTCRPNSPDLNPVDYTIWGDMQLYVGSTRQKSRWTEAASMCGMAWDKTSSMTQLLMSGANVCVRIIKNCSCQRRTFWALALTQGHSYDNFSVLSLWILKEHCCYCVKYVGFLLFLIFCISQGSVATRLRDGGNITTVLLQISCWVEQWKNF